MFATATKRFVKAVDDEGSLMPVSSPNDSEKLNLLSLVVKQKDGWFGKKTKYVYTDFTLNDVLAGDTPLTPAVDKKEFVKYSGKYVGKKEMNLGGEGDADLVRLNLDVGKDQSSTHQSTFGRLKKEELDVNKLLNDSKNQALDMSHCLIKQIREKSGDVLGVVKERILTINPSSILEKAEQSVHMGADLGIPALPRPIKAAVKGNVAKEIDSQAALEIAAQTVIAYSVIEIMVQPDGKYELCLLSKSGGFEKGTTPSSTPVSSPSSTPSIIFVGPTGSLSEHYQRLSALPTSTRSSLFQLLRTTMENRLAITVLENMLSQMRAGEKPDLGDVKEASVRKTVKAILDLLRQSEESLVSTTHLIVSAMDEMTDEGITVLGSCCSPPPVLQALQLLVQSVTDSRESSLKDAGLAPLADKKVYERVERLFASSDVTLKRQEDTLQTEIGKTSGNLPLVMCITVKGLASLS